MSHESFFLSSSLFRSTCDLSFDDVLYKQMIQGEKIAYFTLYESPLSHFTLPLPVLRERAKCELPKRKLIEIHPELWVNFPFLKVRGANWREKGIQFKFNPVAKYSVFSDSLQGEQMLFNVSVGEWINFPLTPQKTLQFVFVQGQDIEVNKSQGKILFNKRKKFFKHFTSHLECPSLRQSSTCSSSPLSFFT